MTPAKGHWPKGKRRHADPRGDWQQVRLNLAALLESHWSRDQVNAKALARAIGVDQRAARNWISGIDRPSEERQEMVARWVREQRERIQRESKQ